MLEKKGMDHRGEATEDAGKKGKDHRRETTEDAGKER